MINIFPTESKLSTIDKRVLQMNSPLAVCVCYPCQQIYFHTPWLIDIQN